MYKCKMFSCDKGFMHVMTSYPHILIIYQHGEWQLKLTDFVNCLFLLLLLHNMQVHHVCYKVSDWRRMTSYMQCVPFCLAGYIHIENILVQWNCGIVVVFQFPIQQLAHHHIYDRLTDRWRIEHPPCMGKAGSSLKTEYLWFLVLESLCELKGFNCRESEKLKTSNFSQFFVIE